MIKISRFWYNFKDSLCFYRELLFGTPWSKIKGNENKKKPCLFIRFLDRASIEIEEGGRRVHKDMEFDAKFDEKINKALGLSPEAKNAKRFL